ncbi:ATP-dependent Clp protease ATP-binding subunit [Pseudenhygromyxa sp. WMMC2535]|uniref:AAA family ATPase n=1 Tax=Pseudenhygromyxa sp. WMMC2535 TaxID=2712867 RepID=UPI0015554D58|nr:AAA family ATPase [Pseudenhygromyxa sp. WMMC2535]NVB42885.1 ATP-dependent Clp protease ATP-binding subunit [Pseudenhygromyxa sp. WMMC2535]
MAATDFSVTVFQRQVGTAGTWVSLGFGAAPIRVTGRTSTKLRERFVAACRERVRGCAAAELPELQLVRGRKLVRLAIDITLRRPEGRERFAGRVPLVLESRPLGPDRLLPIAYHPLRPNEWFPYLHEGKLGERAATFFQQAWLSAGLAGEELDWLRSQGREQLKLIAFRAEPKSLLSALSSRRRGPEMARIGARKRRPGTSLLDDLGIDLTRKASDEGPEALSAGMIREPYREQLRQLLCGERKAPALLIGPPGVGKTTLVHRAVLDLLDADGWASHQNLDRVHHVWQISGRRIIAGMSYLGQWEQRCVELLEETYAKQIVLYADDLHAWGRIGESQQSDRSLASFFRGPVARGELTLIGACSPEQFQQLQADASAFANLFTTIHVEPTTPATTLRMLVHEGRKLERVAGCAFDARVYRAIFELAGSLDSGGAHPGKALELLRALAARHRVSSERIGDLELADVLLRPPPDGHGRPRIGAAELISLLSERTGMPELLLAADDPLSPRAVYEAFSAQVMGQPQAVEVVRDLIVRIKAGLCDPSRPYGVFLFTGPTGTGKTELAKALAAYLFGDESRLVRLDMSEYNVPGAAARLIGDRYTPQGVLTAAVRAQPFCVVLLDEVEKADPSVLNLMLQLFDDGRLSDATGEVADFRHAVVIMTSNLGASAVPAMGFGARQDSSQAQAVLQDIARAVREFFPPELFNRIDRVVQFRPLDRPAARAIARKELGRLLGRRGLSERNVFVRYTDSVLDLVVAEGFDAKDGARSLKRWLEDNVGSLLVDTLTRSPGASMRLLWIYTGARGRLRVHEQALREAEPIPDHSRMSELLERPTNALVAQLPAALEFLRSLDHSPRLAALSRTLAALLDAFNRKTGEKTGEADSTPEANALYNLEILRGEISELRAALELHASYDQRLEGKVEEAAGPHEGLGEQLELERFESEEIQGEEGVVLRRRRLDRRALVPNLPLRERQTMLRAIAEVWFLERAIANAEDPEQHVVFLELGRVGAPGPGAGRQRFSRRGGGLFERLTRAYVEQGRGDVEAWAALRRGEAEDEDDHRVLAGRSEGATSPGLFELAADPHVDLLVLQLVGPSVREFFAGESGSQVLEVLGGGQEIVRVRVLDTRAGDDPKRAIERTLSQRQAFAMALEGHRQPASSNLPHNPDAMLAIIRRFKLEEARPGRPQAVEVEDYPLSHAASHGGAALEAVLELLWLMRVGVALSPNPGDDRP